MRNNDDYGVVFVTKVTSKNVQTNIIETLCFPLFSENVATHQSDITFILRYEIYIFVIDL